MKLAVTTKYGSFDAIEIIEAEIPKIAPGEVLVKVKGAALNPKDILIRKGKFKNFTGKKFPLTIGFDFAGIVEESNSSHYQKGDRVFGMLNGWKGGCCAEYVVVNPNEMYHIPKNISFVEAAGIPLAGQTAFQAMWELGKLKSGQTICMNGASGGVGTLAIQIAKALGGHVTTISSTKNMDFCKSLGADKTLSYETDDFLNNNVQYDIFFDIFGNQSFPKTAHLLKPKGTYISTVPSLKIIIEQFWNLFRRKKAKLVVVKSKRDDLQWFASKIKKGDIQPVISEVHPFEDIALAQQHIETKRAKGKVILKMEDLDLFVDNRQQTT